MDEKEPVEKRQFSYVSLPASLFKTKPQLSTKTAAEYTRDREEEMYGKAHVLLYSYSNGLVGSGAL